MIFTWRNFVQETRGAVLVLTAVGLAVFLGFCGLAIDVGHYLLVRNELQNAADAGAMAGVRALYPNDLSTVTNPVTPDCANAVTVGLQAAHWNETDQATTVVADIQTGNWDPVNRTFVAGCSNDPDPALFTNAVQVTTHMENTSLFLMQVLGAVPKTIQASSVAAIFPVGGIGPFPVTMKLEYVQFGGQLRIYLNSDTNPDPSLPFDPLTNPGDVGSWFLPGASSSDFLGQVKDVLNGTVKMPLLHKGDPIYMQNGVTTSLASLVDKYVGQTVWLPVVEQVKFNQTDKILGFCGFAISSTGQYKGKHYIQGEPTELAEVPGDSTDGSIGDFYGLLGPAKLVY